MKSFLKLVWLLPLLQFNPAITDSASAGVDCNAVTHTRLEVTVCAEPVLRTLDGELTAALSEALNRGIIDRRAVAVQRNRVARQCRREKSEAFHACLLNAEVTSLEWVAARLGQVSIEILANSMPGIDQAQTRSRPRRKASSQRRIIDRAVKRPGWKYSASPDARISHLRRQLAVAESRLKSTANPELSVVTLIGLVQAYQRQSIQTGAVTRFEQRLAAGCKHSVYGKQWRRVLQENNYSCTDSGQMGRISPADY